MCCVRAFEVFPTAASVAPRRSNPNGPFKLNLPFSNCHRLFLWKFCSFCGPTGIVEFTANPFTQRFLLSGHPHLLQVADHPLTRTIRRKARAPSSAPTAHAGLLLAPRARSVLGNRRHAMQAHQRPHAHQQPAGGEVEPSPPPSSSAAAPPSSSRPPPRKRKASSSSSQDPSQPSHDLQRVVNRFSIEEVVVLEQHFLKCATPTVDQRNDIAAELNGRRAANRGGGGATNTLSQVQIK